MIVMAELEDAVTVTINSSRLRSDANGFSRLARLHHEIDTKPNATIHVDMSKLEWMDGHLASALLIVARRAQSKGKVIRFANTKPAVKSVLQRNGLFKNRVDDRAGTTMAALVVHASKDGESRKTVDGMMPRRRPHRSSMRSAWQFPQLCDALRGTKARGAKQTSPNH
jgi:anti-anti-sigma regulatory factor